MKKWFSMVLILALTACVFTACGKQAAAPGPEGTPEQIIEKIYANHKQIDLVLAGMDVDLQDSNAVTYYTGLANADKLSAVSVSETMLGQPYSLVVARVKNAADSAAIAKEMLDKIDPRKWICVAADTRTAGYCGDVVMYFMVSSDFAEDVTAQSVADAFQTVCSGSATILK